MKRIGVFLGSSPYNGGTFQYNLAVLDAVRTLPPHQFEVVTAYTDRLWMDHLNGLGKRSTYVNLSRFASFFGHLSLPSSIARRVAPFLSHLGHTLVNQRCDLWIFPSQDVWSHLLPLPALATIHDLMHRYERRFPEVGSNQEYRWREWHYKQMCLWAKGILVDSQVGKEQVIASYGVDEHRVHVLPFIRPTYVEAAETIDDDCVVQKYKLPSKFIFYPAQLWKHKNHESLIRAVGLVHKEHPDINLVLVGSHKNGYSPALALVNDLNLQECVHFLGYVPNEEMPALYRQARALIMPTFFGPTNIPPLEAFYHNCPAAVSDIYAAREQLGDAALYFDPSSVEDISSSINKLWTDDKLCEDLRERGRMRASLWTQTEFTHKLLNIIDLCCS